MTTPKWMLSLVACFACFVSVCNCPSDGDECNNTEPRNEVVVEDGE